MGHILDMHEIHGLLSVTKNYRRLASIDALHPSDKNLGIAAVDIHARAVNVEIPIGDVVEAMHILKSPQQAFIESLGCPVESAVVIRMLVFSCRKLVSHSVDGG